MGAHILLAGILREVGCDDVRRRVAARPLALGRSKSDIVVVLKMVKIVIVMALGRAAPTWAVPPSQEL